MKNKNVPLKITLLLKVSKDGIFMARARLDAPRKSVRKAVKDEIVSWLSDLGIDVADITIETV